MIHDGYHDDLRIDRLARSVGISPTRLINLFRACTGLPVHQYLIALRLSKAMNLLANGTRPPSAAIESGFYDLRHLGREMKARLGFTPSEYFGGGRRRS